MSTIVLDPGHGGNTTAGKSSPNGYVSPGSPPEKEIALAVARSASMQLGGATLTREGDVNLTLAERRARAAGAQAFVSIHASSPQSGQPEVWVHPRSNSNSQALANAIASALGGRVRSDAEMAILHPDGLSPGLAACLVEADLLAARDSQGAAQTGAAIARGIRSWMQGGAMPLGRRLGTGDIEDPDISEPIPEEFAGAQGLQQSRGLTITPEYPQASRFEPARTGHYRTPASPRSVERVVIHITDGRTTSGVVSWFQSASNTGKTSSHYVVGQDGEVIQMVRHADIAHHAGSANRTSIGIEHVAESPRTARSRGRAALYPSDTQYCASAALVSWLCDQYGIPKDRAHILGHSEASSTTHADCPNSVWDWDHFMNLVRNNICEPRAGSQGLSQMGGFYQPHGLAESYGNKRSSTYNNKFGNPLLESAKFVWDLVKDGAKASTATKRVNVIPAGTQVTDYSWSGPAVYEERFQKTSWLGFDMVNFTMKVSWFYDGRYISNFTVDADGFADLTENVDISVETLDAMLEDGVVHLPYRIYFKERHAFSGARVITYMGVAYGNGGGRGGF